MSLEPDFVRRCFRFGCAVLISLGGWVLNCVMCACDVSLVLSNRQCFCGVCLGEMEISQNRCCVL